MAESVLVSGDGVLQRHDGTIPNLRLPGTTTVSNPAPPGTPNAPASIGEVQDLIAAEPTPGNRLDVSGGLVNVGPEVPTLVGMDAQALSPVSNTTAETDLTGTDAVVAAGVLAVNGWNAVVTAGGYLENTSGSTVTTTLRLRCHDGTTDHILASWSISVVNDTLNVRPWSLTATIHMIDFIGLRPCTIGSWMLSPGNAAPFLVNGSNQTGAVLDASGTATTWRMTAQHSTAATSIKAVATAAALLYSGPAV